MKNTAFNIIKTLTLCMAPLVTNAQPLWVISEDHQLHYIDEQFDYSVKPLDCFQFAQGAQRTLTAIQSPVGEDNPKTLSVSLNTPQLTTTMPYKLCEIAYRNAPPMVKAITPPETSHLGWIYGISVSPEFVVNQHLITSQLLINNQPSQFTMPLAYCYHPARDRSVTFTQNGKTITIEANAIKAQVRALDAIEATCRTLAQPYQVYNSVGDQQPKLDRILSTIRFL